PTQMARCVPAGSLASVRPGGTSRGWAADAEHAGGHREGPGSRLSDCLLRFPVCGPEASRGGRGEEPTQPEGSAGETDEERPPRGCERPRGTSVVYHGRASHPRLGTGIPLQLELVSDGRRVGGTWCMLRRSVDVVAERTDAWPLVVRSFGGGTSAELWGKEVAPGGVAGEFFFGAEGGGSFELQECLQVSVSAESVDWGSSSPCGSSSAESSVVPTMQEPVGYYGMKRLVQPSGTKASADKIDSKLIFTSEAHLAEALVEVLKKHPNGIDLAQLKRVIHSSSGVWVSEALLGYKKLRDLVRSPTMSKACWFQSVGSCYRVFGYPSAGQVAACG
ncbi:unnamed protein product, partial [Prorocentrum cordatum]